MKSLNYNQVEICKELSVKTGSEILDSFLSNEGGFVEKSAIFLTGTPGAGKTTFSIFIQNLLKNHKTSFYSREMSASLIRSQMKRFFIEHDNAYIADREMCPTLNDYIQELNCLHPKVVIVDSLQVIMKEDYISLSADVSGFEIIQKLRRWAEENDAILIVIGHVNKDGEFEGRNTIQHMFDAHLEMIFDKKKNSRTISWAKNRMGAVGKIIHYEFSENSINFYVKDADENRALEECIRDMIFCFIKTLDKTPPQYKPFSKELFENLKRLNDLNLTFFDMNIQTVIVMKKLLDKYQF